jgi:hypothetical protein
MLVRLLVDCEGRTTVRPAGTMIEDPFAYRLVQLGVAEACDHEVVEALAAIGISVSCCECANDGEENKDESGPTEPTDHDRDANDDVDGLGG